MCQRNWGRFRFRFTLEPRRHRRLRRLVGLRLRLTRDLRLHGRAIVPVTHR